MKLNKLVINNINKRYFSSSSSSSSYNINNVAVLGCGLMGNGIAQVSAQAGKQVKIFDTNEDALNNGMKAIENSLNKLESKGKIDNASDVFKNIEPVKSIEDLQTQDIIIEAIIENIDIKQTVWKNITDSSPANTIFASNTSSFLIEDITAVVSDDAASRFLGLHYFNPVPMMKLVEIVKTKKTSDDVFNATMQFAKDQGKTPIQTSDTPGFVVNRLLVPYIAQAMGKLLLLFFNYTNKKKIIINLIIYLYIYI